MRFHFFFSRFSEEIANKKKNVILNNDTNTKIFKSYLPFLKPSGRILLAAILFRVFMSLVEKFPISINS